MSPVHSNAVSHAVSQRRQGPSIAELETVRLERRMGRGADDEDVEAVDDVDVTWKTWEDSLCCVFF